jgi:hypothetical protein
MRRPQSSSELRGYNVRNYEDIFLEGLRIEREARARVLHKLASRQLGEAWVGIGNDPRAGAGRLLSSNPYPVQSGALQSRR